MTNPALTKAEVRAFDPRITLGLVCLAIFIGAVDLTVISAVLPKVMIDLRLSLDTELNRASWAVSGYLLAYTVSITFMGRLSDLLGRRMVYLVCLIVFLIGSAWVAAAPNLTMLIIGRVVQALGAGAMVPVSMALVGDLFPPGQRAAALGLIGAVDTAGWMVGHLYGGVLMRIFDDWRLLFWLNLPIGLVALGLTWYALRQIPTPPRAGHFDWLGTMLLSGSLVALNVGLAAGSELGATDFYGERLGPPPYAGLLVLVALVLLALFVWAERRSPDPLIGLELFTRRDTAMACVINVMVGFGLAIAITNVPLYINTYLLLYHPTDSDILRIAAWDAGWMLSALTLTMAAAALPGGLLTGRYGGQLPALLGLGLALVGSTLMAFWGPEATYLRMGLELALTGIGLGLVIAPVADTVVAAAGEDRRGAASALVIALRLVGMTVGVAILTLWGVHRQDELRRAGADNPLAMTDPARFLMEIAAQVIGETFLFGVAAYVVGLLAAWFMRQASADAVSKQ
ncbi:MFS transporter [uncultured Chloroflexus sp.]|uniref:MFS transporter n=1 Tax=uncultured Chloroflexus sp. TaxID=214040 RepID=UPI002635B22A|nr:MFS transporter [uncultured Chloroflexus sp.]